MHRRVPAARERVVAVLATFVASIASTISSMVIDLSRQTAANAGLALSERMRAMPAKQDLRVIAIL